MTSTLPNVIPFHKPDAPTVDNLLRHAVRLIEEALGHAGVDFATEEKLLRDHRVPSATAHESCLAGV